MKRVVSISLGSSKRDASAEVEVMGERVRVERIGTDGNLPAAIERIRELDGKVDAIGLGGTDLYIWAGKRRYTFRDARRMAEAARITPVVDGSGLKGTLERKVIRYLQEHEGWSWAGRRVLLVSSVDRYGMAEALAEAGADTIFGDFIFALGLPIPLRTLRQVELAARMLAPIIVRLPFQLLYPTGKKQEENTPKHGRFFHWAEVIAGDFHFIRRYMPEDLSGKTLVTNTVTAADVEELRRRRARCLVTTTPKLNGRSFATNVMEGVLVALSGKRPEELTPADYERLLDQMHFAPRIEPLAEGSPGSSVPSVPKPAPSPLGSA